MSTNKDTHHSSVRSFVNIARRLLTINNIFAEPLRVVEKAYEAKQTRPVIPHTD